MSRGGGYGCTECGPDRYCPREEVQQMVQVLDLAYRGRLPYPDASGTFFPDDPGLEGKAQTACGSWITLIEGDGDPYVMLTVEGRDLLAKLRARLAEATS